MKTSNYEPKYTTPTMDDVLERYSDRIEGIHEACKSVPEIGQQDFDLLVESVKQDGLQRPIEIDNQRRLIDGRCDCRPSWC